MTVALYQPRVTPDTEPTHLFRAMWPIPDTTSSFPELMAQAYAEVPHLARMQRASIVGDAGKFSVALSKDVPGSGNTTQWVLLFVAPAITSPRPLV